MTALLSPTLGAWDSIPELRRLREHNDFMDAQEADRQARKELKVEAYLDTASEGDVRAPCFFVEQRAGVAFKAPSLTDVTWDALDTDELRGRAIQILLDAALGMPVQQKAAALLEAAAENFAEGEVDRD